MSEANRDPRLIWTGDAWLWWDGSEWIPAENRPAEGVRAEDSAAVSQDSNQSDRLARFDFQPRRFTEAWSATPVDLPWRKRRTILYSALTIVLPLLGLFLATAAAVFPLGDPKWWERVFTTTLLAGLVVSTLAFVGIARLHTPEGGITPWKRVAVTALVPWASVAAYVLSTMSTAAVTIPIGLVTFACLPSIIWFPIWVVVAAIRGGMHPERVARRVSDVVAQTSSE